MTDQSDKKDNPPGIEGKLLGVILSLAAAYLIFRLTVGGIFHLMMGNNPENGIYVFFYGGIVVLAVLAVIGIAAFFLLVRRVKGGPKTADKSAAVLPAAPPPGALSRGITLGLVVIIIIVLSMLGLFVWLKHTLG